MMHRAAINKGNTKAQSTQNDLDSMIMPKDAYKLLLTLALEGFIEENGFNPNEIAGFLINTMGGVYNLNLADDFCESIYDERTLDKQTTFANNKENTSAYLNAVGGLISNQNIFSKKASVKSLATGVQNINLSAEDENAADVGSNRQLNASY
jgi:hypothetical protein